MIINNEQFDIKKSTFLSIKVKYTNAYAPKDRNLDTAREFLSNSANIDKNQLDKLAEYLLDKTIIIKE